MIKFSHSVFALPFAGIALIETLPGSRLWGKENSSALYLLIFQVVIAMVTLRSAAMGFNRLADRNIDAKNPRTEKREIPDNRISVVAVRMSVVVSLLLFVSDAFWIHRICGVLAPVAVLLAIGYSYTKRFTYLCHYVLGAAIGIAPAGAWIAVKQQLDPIALLWSGVLTLYIAGFDILYSLQDITFDKSEGLSSIPARFGVKTSLYIARATHLLSFILILTVARLSHTGWIFAATAIITGTLFATEHLMVTEKNLTRIPIAFFNVNAMISVVLFTGLLLDRVFITHNPLTFSL